jgi:integrase
MHDEAIDRPTAKVGTAVAQAHPTNVRGKRFKTRNRGIYYRLDVRQRRRYIVWYEDSDGKGRTETLPLGSTEQQALQRQSELRAKIARGERVAPVRMTVKDFAQAWLEEQKDVLAPKTIDSYRWAIDKHIVPAFGRRQLQDVTIDDVAILVAKMRRDGKKAWTIRGVLTPLSRIFAVAVRRGYRNTNPVRGLDKAERPKSDQKQMVILTSSEIAALLAAVDGWKRTLLATLVFTGMRIGEALALTWEQVDFGRNAIVVGESKTRAGEGREIVMIPSLAARLLEHKLETTFGAPSDLVFPTATGAARDRRNVLRWALEPAREAIGSTITLHGLRHTFASLLIGQGFDVTFVANQLGHANPSITLKVYARLFDPASRKDEARTKLEAAFGAVV